MEYEIKNIDYNKEVFLSGYKKEYHDEDTTKFWGLDNSNSVCYSIVKEDSLELTAHEGKLLSTFIMNMPEVTVDYFNERITVLEHDYYNDDGLFIYYMDIELIIFRMMLYFNSDIEYKKHHKLINKILKEIDTWSSDYVFISGFYLMNEEI